MRDKIFLDSNVVIYSLGRDEVKKKISVDLLKNYPTISAQVVNEVVNVSLKKLKMSKNEAFEIGKTLIRSCEVVPVNDRIVLNGFEISERYHLSFWDSLIISAALENDCSIIYTEDLQHNQLIEDRLLIRDPYKEK
ncbi:MAG: PIN domain-containing protein [Candidatus Aminicenantes bacterium]|nr:PIN domain-containing protein [Candidatus Aminicenantes bacterium]